MTRVLPFAAAFFFIALFQAAAQETPNQPQRPRRASEPADSTAPGSLVTLDIALIDRPGADNESAALSSAAELLELDKQGKLDRVMRIRLSTVSGRKATMQIGQRVPTVTGRTAAGRGGFSSAQRDSGDGPRGFTYSFAMENVGTIINAAPRVEDDGTVLVDLQIERSRLADIPRPADEDGGPGGVARQKTVSLTSQSTLRLKAGEPALAEGYSSVGDETRAEYIVVTAHVEKAPAQSAAAERREPERQLRIFNLANAQAHDVLPLLEKIVGREVRFAADAATNTVIASGAPEQLSTTEALLQRLDESKK